MKNLWLIVFFIPFIGSAQKDSTILGIYQFPYSFNIDIDSNLLFNNFDFDSFPDPDSILIKVKSTSPFWQTSFLQIFTFHKQAGYYIANGIIDSGAFVHNDTIPSRLYYRKIPEDSVRDLISDIKKKNKTFKIKTSAGDQHMILTHKKSCGTYIDCADCHEYEISLSFTYKGKFYECDAREAMRNAPLYENGANMFFLMRWMYACRMAKLFLSPHHDFYRFFSDSEIKRVADWSQK